MQFYHFLLGVLSVWRITHLLQAEDGPWDMVVHLRRRAGASFWGQLLDCFYCLSIWISVPFAVYLGRTLDERFLTWLALSAGAILLQRATANEYGNQLQFFEESEENHVLLRSEENPS